MSEIFSVQLTAAATVALAVLALATAVLALLAWRKQSREVIDQAEMLRLQAEMLQQVTADREREAMERRREQAQLVYVHRQSVSPLHDLDPYAVSARVYNTSRQPVYDPNYRWHVAGDPVGIELWRGNLSPGGEVEEISECPADVRLGDIDARVTFRDRAGAWWSLWGWSGNLEEIPEPPDAWRVRFRYVPARRDHPHDARHRSARCRGHRHRDLRLPSAPQAVARGRTPT